VLKSTLQKGKVLHPPSSGILVPSLLYRYKLPDASRVTLEVRGHCPSGILQDDVTAVMAGSMRAPLRRGPRPRPPMGATTRPLKPKSWRLGGRWRWWSRQRRQPPLQRAASPAAVTTSAPTTAATFAPVAYRRRRPPQRMQKGPRPRPPMEVRTRPSKNATATSAACDVLYDPLGGVGAVRSAAQGTPRMR
jgi:hypothetical protein